MFDQSDLEGRHLMEVHFASNLPQK